MAGRFLDNEAFVREAEGFVQRNHGTSMWWMTVAFIIAFSFIIVSLSLISYQDIWILMLAVAFIMASLLAVVSSFVLKDRNYISAVELQNAIFAGVAKLSTEFCVILKHDGTVVYVDPEYNKKFLHLRSQGISDIDALCESGGLNKKERSKLLGALNEGKKESISFNLAKTSAKSRALALMLEPIGIYDEKEGSKRFNLAVKPIERPSGYFFLKANADEHILHQDAELFHDLAIGTYSIDGRGYFKNINNEMLYHLGYDEASSQDLIFKDLFYDPEDSKKILSHNIDYMGVVISRHKDQHAIRSFIIHRAIKDSKGKVIERCGAVIPFPEAQMKPENNNDDSNMPDIVENMPIATATLNLDGTIIRSNKAFQHITDSRNIKTLLDIITDELKQQVGDMVHNVATGVNDGSKSVDIKINGRKDATASLYISRITDKDKAIKGLIVHLIDSTELKNLEMRFVHSQKMQAVGQLAGGIAHDFNNLLTAMMGFCDLLLMRHPAGDQSFADIMQIKQNANRAANLVRQLLAFSRKQTLQPKVINITDVLADLSNLIGRLIGENIELKMIHGRDLGKVKVDPVQLEQVIINLAVNARDAISDSGVLTIKTSNVTIDAKTKIPKNMIPPADDEHIVKGKYVLIEVSDTGCGIKANQISKIFEPFFSTKEIGSGTGLGLSTVYGIIKQTDGYIYVSSQLKKGTRFSIFLKSYDSEKENKPVVKKETEKTKKNVLPDLMGKGTILLVEDETPVRIFSNSALVSKGYTVLEAEDAQAALKIVDERGSELDVIITDVVMPGMSGPDMIKKVSKKYPKVKVIFISGYGEDAFLETYGSERKFNFLSKPYSLKQLAAKVKEVMEGSS